MVPVAAAGLDDAGAKWRVGKTLAVANAVRIDICVPQKRPHWPALTNMLDHDTGWPAHKHITRETLLNILCLTQIDSTVNHDRGTALRG